MASRRRRFRYWLACKLLPEMLVYANPSSRVFARATYDMLHSEARYVDETTRDVLLQIAGDPRYQSKVAA